jgi:hypothetical protein
MKNHPLRTYLSYGLDCVQGTDGGALYGTDSMDEQLALERFLGLSTEEMMRMKNSESRVLAGSLKAFDIKMRNMPEVSSVTEYYRQKIRETAAEPVTSASAETRLISEVVLADQIRSLPEDRLPVIIAGGSFNNDSHVTKVRSEGTALIDRLLEEGNPENIYFVIGHQLNGYEKYLLDRNDGRFMIYAIVPKMITRRQAGKLKESGVRIRVSIEASAMGLYKSFAYEIFKRRKAVLLAFDGNSAGANMIQEAINGGHRSLIYVNRRSRALKVKASSLLGYVTMFMPETGGICETIIQTAEEEKGE